MKLSDIVLSAKDTKSVHRVLDGVIKKAAGCDADVTSDHISIPFPAEQKQLYFTVIATLSPYMPRLDTEPKS